MVIISNSSQQQSAWASVLWFNMLSQDPKVISHCYWPTCCAFAFKFPCNTITGQTKLIVYIWCAYVCFSQDVMFFANTPAATWPQFGEMLSWQFLSATKRGLDDTQLEMIANKLFGKFFHRLLLHSAHCWQHLLSCTVKMYLDFANFTFIDSSTRLT